MVRSTKTPVAKNLQSLFDPPLVKRTSHPDLKRISSANCKSTELKKSSTFLIVRFQLVNLLEEQRDELLVVDARYPFEYAGGHIASAQNIYTENDLRLLFSNLILSSSRPSIIVFHCEFSSERGPRLCRLFRSLDRQYNMTNYPELSFPSVYLLDGGYAEFFTQSLLPTFLRTESLRFHVRRIVYARIENLSTREESRSRPNHQNNNFSTNRSRFVSVCRRRNAFFLFTCLCVFTLNY